MAVFVSGVKVSEESVLPLILNYITYNQG